MDRRKFIATSATIGAGVALMPGQLPAHSDNAAAPASSGASSGSSPGVSEARALPDYAGKFLHSDMHENSGRNAGTRGESMNPSQMALTKEERDILNGSRGVVLAKVMKIVVDHGNIFGADKLVDLGGACHSSMYFGTAYMAPLIKIFDECAKAGLKAYAPYTVNPRPYDVYNVNNNAKDIELIYDGYALQRDVDYVHSRLGATEMNYRSCACYVDEVGNAPAPGTFVAWAESSAVNYGNSVLGIRTNRRLVKMMLELEKVPEGNGTMMDNTLIVYTSNNADKQHTNGANWPVVLLGNFDGRIKTGCFTQLDGKRPINALYATIKQATTGRSVDRFNMNEKMAGKFDSSVGPLTELLV